MQGYETVIGLEVHCELSTKSKMFCGCPTEFGAEANTHICPVCTGLPGALPVLNRQVPEMALAAALALGCDITRENSFDRKNYFYPDLPKAYQISQRYCPIGRNGHLDIKIGDREKRIGITEIHMEEDAGKMFHESGGESLIDYNRCGLPLLEIVSEPDMRDAEEVIAYLKKLRDTLRYLGVSHCRMQEGSFRADINVSVRRAGDTGLNPRSEIKNMNSFHAIERAVNYESRRQTELMESGMMLLQDTRRWDENRGISLSMRGKESADDYRYFPEPDLPPLLISDEDIDRIKKQEPELREARCQRFVSDYGLSPEEAYIVTDSPKMADLFEEVARACGKPSEVFSWLSGETLRLLKKHEMDSTRISFSGNALAQLIEMLSLDEINRGSAKEIFEKVFEEDVSPREYAASHSMFMENDQELITESLEKVLAENPEAVAAYRGGKKKAAGFLMGEMMRMLKGRADPAVLSRMISERLEEDEDTGT